MTPFRDSYLVYACPECGEHYQFAGFCDRDHARLRALSCIPVDRILSMRDEAVASSSPVPAEFIRWFVEKLLGRSPRNQPG